MKRHALLVLFAIAACSSETPQTLGASAARAEKAFFVFGTNADAHAGAFMKSWVRACALASKEKATDMFDVFVRTYIEELQDEPGAATAKPLQKYVRDNWWKSGTGCETINKETPEWALN